MYYFTNQTGFSKMLKVTDFDITPDEECVYYTDDETNVKYKIMLTKLYQISEDIGIMVDRIIAARHCSPNDKTDLNDQFALFVQQIIMKSVVVVGLVYI